MAQRKVDQPGCVGIHMALASYYFKMKDLTKAEEYLDNALKLDPKNSEVLWLQAKVRKDKNLEQQTKKCKEKFVPSKQGRLKMKDPLKAERCAFSNLTPKEFLFQYAMTGKPVIITGLVQHMTSNPWNVQYIRRVIGHKILPTRQQQPEESHPCTVEYLIDSLHSNDRKSSCSYEWTMTSIGSDLTKDLHIPRYVANDFLQRTNTGYCDEWPCLHIESAGVANNMHIELFGLNRWIALFEGRKRFTFVRREDMPCLYPYCNDNLDVSFYANINKPDLQDFPLLSSLTPFECILEPGEFLFIPSGTVYSTESLDDSLSLSANYVDLSNISCVKEELNAMILSNPNIKQLFDQLSSETFPSKMWSAQNDLKWEEYKHWPRESYQDFDITQSDCS